MPSERDHHPDDDQLEEYARGTIPAETESKVEEHLLTCEACRNRLSETDAYLSAIRKASSRLRAEEPAAPHGILGKLASRPRRPER